MTEATFPSARVLAIDDDHDLLDNVRHCLQSAGHRVTVADTLADGLAKAASLPFHVCLLDRGIGVDSGFDALPRLRELAPRLRIVMLTAHADVDDAFAALAAGADDYLIKPVSPAHLQLAIARQLQARTLLDHAEADASAHDAPPATVVGADPAMAALRDDVQRAAATDATVLLLGESGTGKGVLARALHAASARAAAPFATVSCPSLPADLLESELFGHARGAFTGAVQSTGGRVALAEGGTLFLDEVGDLPLPLQAKLLRFIEDREYERVGDPTPRRADVRIVAATHRDLAAAVAAGGFRADLFYRLNVVALTVPPLRARPADIPVLAEAFLARFARRHARPARRLSAGALAALRAYPWPGNVRELQNVIERAVILGAGEVVDVPQLVLQPDASGAGLGHGPLEAVERRHIAAVLARSPTVEAAAAELGIDPSTLYRRKKAWGL